MSSPSWRKTFLKPRLSAGGLVGTSLSPGSLACASKAATAGQHHSSGTTSHSRGFLPFSVRTFSR